MAGDATQALNFQSIHEGRGNPAFFLWVRLQRSTISTRRFCASRTPSAVGTTAYFEVNLATSKVSFPKGDPPRSVTVEITDNEFAFIVPYNYYEVKIDCRSGLVLTRSNRRIWAENGTCTPVKANERERHDDDRRPGSLL